MVQGFAMGVDRCVMLVLALVTSWTYVTAAENLLENPSFEDEVGREWGQHGYTGERFVGDTVHGQNSLRCTNRKKDLSGPSQYVTGMTPGRGYELTAYVKLLSDSPDKLWQQLKAVLKFDLTEKVVRGSRPILVKPVCKGLKGPPRNTCLAKLRQWRFERGEKRKEQKRLKELRKKEKQERKEKSKARKENQKKKAALKAEKKKEKARKKKEKAIDRERKKKEKGIEKERKKKEKEKEKERKEKEKEKEKERKMKDKEKENERKKKEKVIDRERKKKEKEIEKERKEKEKEKEKERKMKDKQKENERKKKEKESRVKVKERKQKERERKKKEKERKNKEKERKKRQQEHKKNKKMKPKTGTNKPPITEELTSEQSLSAQTGHMTPTQRLKRQAVSSSTRHQIVYERGRRQTHQESSAPEGDTGESLSQVSYIIALRAFATAADGWILLTGNINAPVIPFSGAELTIRGPDAGIDFLLDNVTLYEIPEHPDWLAASHVMIDRHRKSHVDFRFTVPENINPADVDVQISLKSHQFAFGSKIEDDLLTSAKTQEFRDLFYNLFNWATIGSFKWRFDKGDDLFSPDFSNAASALEVLLEHEIKVRAHSILWGVQKNIPEAVINTPVPELPELLKFHTEYMVNLTRGKVEHWDVQNELMHGHWYEETMRDPDVSQNIFRMTRPLDRRAKLYLNDFTAVTTGPNTEELHDTALRFKREGTGIQGIGVQGHVKEFMKPDPTMIWRRLDRLADTGLEIFMTEFDVGWDDEAERANWFEDAMRAFFAHPALGGVILWGFWRERQRDKNKYLVYGDHMQFAEQGERFVCLTQKEWTTRQTVNLDGGLDGFSLRAFQGDYEVVVSKRGTPVQREIFILGKENQSVHIRVTDSEEAIAIDQKYDYVPRCISHRDQRSLGNATSASSATGNLTCSDHVSVASGYSEGAEVTVTCPEGTVMTGCSSFQATPSLSARHGERLTVESGVATCTALNGAQSPHGVRAAARCCQAKALRCDYRQAGPSSPFHGAMAEAKCPTGSTPMGCTAYSQYSDLDGAHPDSTMTSCLARAGPVVSPDPPRKSGSISGAACCTGPGLTCRAVTSSQPPATQDDAIYVTCPPGDVMTDCSALSDSGGTAGALVYAEPGSGVAQCRVFPGKNQSGTGGARVTAQAICCNSH